MIKTTLIPIFKTGYFIEIRSEVHISVLKQNKMLTYKSPTSIGKKIKDNKIKNKGVKKCTQ